MNKKKPYFKIVFGSATEDHLSQILAGFQMLKAEKELDFEVHYNSEYIKEKYLHKAAIEVVVDNTVLLYDLTDGYHNIHSFKRFDKILDQVDFYFKRSNSIELNSQLANKNKLFSLGLNYHVSCSANPYDRYYNWKKLKGIELIKDYLFYLRSNKRFQNNYFYQNFESNGKKYKDYNVLFNCRLYDSSSIKFKTLRIAYPELSDNEVKQIVDKWKLDLYQVTEQRINIVKILKDNLKNKFIGGISVDEYSRRVAPDLLLPPDNYMKFNYLKFIKTNNICISSRGLHNSIGWKFGEYVAAGKAIISDRLNYSLPGNFHVNKNYLEYKNPENLVTILTGFVENIEAVHEMENNNRQYYNESMKPNILVKNSLIIAGFM